MPWCPNCKYEYQPEITVCPDCGSELIANPELVDTQPRVIPVLECAALLILGPLVVMEYGHNAAWLALLIGAVAYGRLRRPIRSQDTIKEGYIAALVGGALIAFVYGLVTPPSYRAIVPRIVMLLCWLIISGLMVACIWLGAFLRSRKGLD